MIRYFVDPFGPIFNYPPRRLSIAEPSPVKKDKAKPSPINKDDDSIKPTTRLEPVKGSSLEVVCPAVQKTEKKEPEKNIIPTGSKKIDEIKAAIKKPSLEKMVTDKEKEKIKMSYHKDKKHDDHCEKDSHYHKCCCEFPEPVYVMKAFEWCDYKHYYEDIEKFIEYIKEYACAYPCVLIKWEVVYPSKCKLRICVFFDLCDYEKAFEIELALQKKYRKLKMHHHHHYKDKY